MTAQQHSTLIALGAAGVESICACGWRSFALPTRQEAARLALGHKRLIVTLPPHLEAREAAAHPWPARVPGDGPRDCACYGCEGHVPRWERGKLMGCEYKDHHCDDCHEHQRCTVPECGFGLNRNA